MTDYTYIILALILLGVLSGIVFWKKQATKIITKNTDQTNPNTQGNFKMIVEQTFQIAGRGTILTGTIESGSIETGEEIFITNETETYKTNILAIENKNKAVNKAIAGDNVGLMITSPSIKINKGAIVTKYSQDEIF